MIYRSHKYASVATVGWVVHTPAALCSRPAASLTALALLLRSQPCSSHVRSRALRCRQCPRGLGTSGSCPGGGTRPRRPPCMFRIYSYSIARRNPSPGSTPAAHLAYTYRVLFHSVPAVLSWSCLAPPEILISCGSGAALQHSSKCFPLLQNKSLVGFVKVPLIKLLNCIVTQFQIWLPGSRRIATYRVHQ